jgi:signal transduction histidine kinase
MTTKAGSGELETLRSRCEALEEQVRDGERDRVEIVDRLLTAEQRERHRIATELHDDTVQVLTAAMISIDRLEHALAADPDQAAGVAHKVRETLAAATERTRRLMFELRPAVGLAAAVRELGEQLGAEDGIDVRLDIEEATLPSLVEEIAYRAVREAVANVRRHAHATRMDIRLALRAGRLEGAVRDDGRGFDVAHSRVRHDRIRLHVGLETLIERIELTGGTAAVTSRPGAGTQVEFAIPLAGRAAGLDRLTRPSRLP